MDRKALMAEWPRNGHDTEGARRLVSRGYPALGPVIPDIVYWLKSNGEVRDVFGAFLGSAGAAASTDAVREALLGTHEEQILYLLRTVLPVWPPSDLKTLSQQLERLLQKPSCLGLHVYALGLLHKAGSETHGSIDEWASVFRRRLRDQQDALDHIEGVTTAKS